MKWAAHSLYNRGYLRLNKVDNDKFFLGDLREQNTIRATHVAKET